MKPNDDPDLPDWGPRKKKGKLRKWAPRVAGISGGILGGALGGAAAGSAIPGLGTLLGAIIGGVAGGLTGAAAVNWDKKDDTNTNN